MNTNPLLAETTLPQFDLIQAKHVGEAVDQVIKFGQDKLKELEAVKDPSWNSILKPLEEISRQLTRTWGPIQHLTGVKNSDDLRKAYDLALPKLISFSLELAQNQSIYNLIKQIRQSEQWDNLNSAQQRIIEKKIQAAKHQGIELEGQDKARFNEISQRLSQLATEFSNNVLDSTKDFSLVVSEPRSMANVPKSFLEAWSQAYVSKNPDKTSNAENGPWLVTLDHPSYEPLMKFCPDDSLREQIYKAHIQRASKTPFENQHKISEILSLRQELANLLGYKTYADLSVADKMADNINAVDSLLSELQTASFSAAQQELEELKAFAKNKGLDREFKNWDYHYYGTQLKEEKFSYSEEEVREYFPMPKVLNGLFGLVHKIFNISVKESSTTVQTWNQDVLFFDVFDSNDEKIAGFYLDPYSRPENKRGGAWMDTCTDYQNSDQKRDIPVAYLVCNCSRPVGDKPSLMNFREVETLFHEFGHGLQHMLTRVEHYDASGINGVEWDAVELPSQFMENWCYHEPTLKSLTEHYETKEIIPTELFKKIKTSKNFHSALQMARQLHFASIDIELHHRFSSGDQDIFALNKAVAQKVTPMPVLEEDRFLCAFSHIFAGGYAAGYYSYKWAEVLSSDAFSRFEEAGLDEVTEVKKIGNEFKKFILEQGGAEHPMVLFKSFRGREPNVGALLKHSGLS